MTPASVAAGAAPEQSATADCVVFDFDGPLCRLFAKHPAAAVADRLARRLEHHDLLPGPGPRVYLDPHAIVRDAALDPTVHSSELCRDLDDLLTQEEVTAAASAELTEGAPELVEALLARGVRLAVVSNNNAEAVRQCLLRFDLLDPFEGRIVGRPGCGRLMKPHPGMVLRAVAELGAAAQRCVMIGDSAADVLAARGAGVRFLGYATDEPKAAALASVGAEYIGTLADAGAALLGG